MRLLRLAMMFFVLLAAWGAALPVARAEEFTLPGVPTDSRAYESSLTRRFPAGGTPQARRAAEQQAAAAIQKKDWTAAVTALEQRVTLGEATAQQWRDLANAWLRRNPPDPQKALLAAWRDYQASGAGDAEIPSLLLMAEALRAMKRDAQVVQALEAVVERAPDNAGYQRMLAEARQAAGMLVRRVRTEGEADPPRACVEFTVAPQRSPDF
jgi:hypothetical protein